MNIVEYLKKKYNVELTGKETKVGNYHNSSILMDVTSHFEELPPFVKQVNICLDIEGSYLSMDEKDELFQERLDVIEKWMEKVIQERDKPSIVWDQDFYETIILICEGGYAIKVTCETALFLMKKYENLDQVYCSVLDDKWLLDQKKG